MAVAKSASAGRRGLRSVEPKAAAPAAHPLPEDVSLLEWAFTTALQDALVAMRLWAAWLLFLVLAGLSFVPLAINPALDRMLQFRLHQFGGPARLHMFPVLPVASTAFAVAWALAALVLGAAISHAMATDVARTEAGVWQRFAVRLRAVTPAMAPWALALMALGAVGLWTVRSLPPGGAWTLGTAVGGLLGVVAWVVCTWLVLAVGLYGPDAARPSRLWQLALPRRGTVVAMAALWLIGLSLVGMLAAAASWAADLWTGIAFYALALPAVWLLATRTSILYMGATLRRAP